MRRGHFFRPVLSAMLVAAALLSSVPAAQPQEALDHARLLKLEMEQLYREGRYPDALVKAREALGLLEREFGPDHLYVATGLNDLAVVLKAHRDYAEARRLFERALAIRSTVLGPTHPEVAQSLFNLALVLHEQRDFAGARPLYERALRIRETALGPAHPRVAAILNNLANVLWAQGESAKARPLHERALEIREAALEPTHPAVAESLDSLVGLLQEQGDYARALPLAERALRLTERALGPNHPDVATRFKHSTELQQAALQRVAELNNEVLQLHRAGRYADAIPKARETLALRASLLGGQHPDVATDLDNLAELLRAQLDFAGARALYERALGIRETALGPTHLWVAQSLDNLAQLLHAQGSHEESRRRQERALQIREVALGPAHPGVAHSLNNLAGTLRAQGDHAAAQALYERALRIREAALGPTHANVAVSLNDLADLLRERGDFAGARPLLERAVRINEAERGPSHPELATTLDNLALLLHAQGRYGEARPLHERALRIREAALGPTHPAVATSLDNLANLARRQGDRVGAQRLYERALRIHEATLGPSHPRVAMSLHNLAGFLAEQRDYGGAWPLHERALEINRLALGPTHPDVAHNLNSLASLLEAQGDYAGARPLYELALQIRETVLGPAHPEVAASLNNLALLLHAQGDHAAARPFLERALQIEEASLGPTHPEVATSLDNLAALLTAQGDFSGARRLHDRALPIHETALGPIHPRVMLSLGNLATLLQRQGDYAGARPLYERVRQVQLAVAAANIDLDDDALRGFLRSSVNTLRDHVGLLAALAREPARDPTASTPASDAFLVAEQARSQSAQRALARAGARAAASTAATATLAQHVQELRDRRAATRRQLIAEYGRPIAGRDEARLSSLKDSGDLLDRDLLEATQRLRVAFPRYAELASPEPIDATTAQSLLKEDEALIAVFTLDARVLVWLLRPGQALAYRDIEIAREDLTRLVTRVRTSLDQSLNADMGAGQLTPFDITASHELYRLLLAPLEAGLAGVKHLIVVPDEVLLPVPFGVLVTNLDDEVSKRLAEASAQRLAPSPADFAAYPRLSWLARAYAITVLPTATSLRALRHSPRVREGDVEPFIGFGDPLFHGPGQRRGTAMLIVNDARTTDSIGSLPPLPGTRRELLALARALGADPGRSLYLGARATKPEVTALNVAGRLGRARVLSFATHGVLAGQILRQPALVLTPPHAVTEADDGLLSLDDIVWLRLTSTDWVVLSACNTGAGDDSGEALSGLARAFFFAGAPTLLVSHWSVDDRATQALMTRVFERYGRDRTLARAEAVRQGMLALMMPAAGLPAYFAHPFAWAAFSVVGEGR